MNKNCLRFKYFLPILILLLFIPHSKANGSLEEVGAGTGFIVDSSGYILTNEHVISGATDINVVIGGEEYEAEVVKSNPDLDLALLKVSAKSLLQVDLATSEEVDLMDEVITIGYPLSFEFGVSLTVNRGSITSIRKSGQAPYFWTDAEINQGNSGGPLVNESGEVVGVVFARPKEEIQAEGVGFALPIDYARPLLKEIPDFDLSRMKKQNGKITRKKRVEKNKSAVVYIKTKREISLPNLLPSRIPDYTQGSLPPVKEPSNSLFEDEFGDETEIFAHNLRVYSVRLEGLRESGFELEEAAGIYGEYGDWSVKSAVVLSESPEETERMMEKFSETGIVASYESDDNILELGWPSATSNDWNVERWKVGNETALNRIKLCTHIDEYGLLNPKGEDSKRCAQLSTTSSSLQPTHALYNYPEDSSLNPPCESWMNFQAESYLTLGRLIVMVQLRHNNSPDVVDYSSGIYSRSDSIYRLEGDKISMYENKGEEGECIIGRRKEVVATVEELTSEFSEVAKLIYGTALKELS